jgi:glutamate N-acetyltransferase/amino-acid N-acetyltransferase
VTVTAVPGFRSAELPSDLTGDGTAELAVVVNDGPLDHAAGLFTEHPVPGAAVLWSRQVLTTGRLRAVVLQVGRTDAVTGPEAFQTVHAAAEHAARALGLGAIEVAVCATDPAGSRRGRATHRDPSGWRVDGFGSGGPNSAALIAVLCTDAVVEAGELDGVLCGAVRATAGQVDRGASAHDTVLLLASGTSGVRVSPEALTAAATEVCAALLDQSSAHVEAPVEQNGAHLS